MLAVPALLIKEDQGKGLPADEDDIGQVAELVHDPLFGAREAVHQHQAEPAPRIQVEHLLAELAFPFGEGASDAVNRVLDAVHHGNERPGDNVGAEAHGRYGALGHSAADQLAGRCAAESLGGREGLRDQPGECFRVVLR